MYQKSHNKWDFFLWFNINYIYLCFKSINNYNMKKIYFFLLIILSSCEKEVVEARKEKELI